MRAEDISLSMEKLGMTHILSKGGTRAVANMNTGIDSSPLTSPQNRPIVKFGTSSKGKFPEAFPFDLELKRNPVGLCLEEQD